VILINLLPHREERRRQRKRSFFIGLGLAAAAGGLVASVAYGVQQQMTAVQAARNGFLKAEINRLEGQIKDIANLRGEIDGLKARQGAVEDLQLNRNVPVNLLDELVKHTPEGIYLSSLKQTDNVVIVGGMAQTNERVSEFLRNVQNNAKWLNPPELVEIRAVTLPPLAGTREQRRLFEFSMRVTVKLPGAAASTPAAASGPVARRSA
jgi:type IV pilus assembly protein PilN